MTESLVDKYSMQYCTDQGCHAYCLTDVKYSMAPFVNNSEQPGADIYITDFHDLRFWKVGAEMNPLQISDTNDGYLIKLDVINEKIKIDDDIKVSCVLFINILFIFEHQIQV